MDAFIKQAAVVIFAFIICVWLQGDDVPRDGLRNGERVSGAEYVARIGFIITKMFSALYGAFILMDCTLKLLAPMLTKSQLAYLNAVMHRTGALLIMFFIAFGMVYLLLNVMQNLVRLAQRRPKLEIVKFP